MPSAIYAVLGVLCAFLGLTGINHLTIVQYAMADQPPQQTCPLGSEIAPCVCNVKKNGLDILCEATDIAHINQAMSKLKARSPIIFYLKLRHNNLPKLQGFVFFPLDIRHLTIHNSSLAVIEESALSSLGKQISAIFIYLLSSYSVNRFCYCKPMATETKILANFQEKVSRNSTYLKINFKIYRLMLSRICITC